ncbi:hypothetical protein Nham_1940 [Nitrobacter hamburgensis X14]|uniref:Uncharacterized protein n=1 Tax=Nitrobacter hamburgensis (strain DSM 10229 / NCIMB 13809 / X14) TaxID=323097 RepID=Q1QM02_NITHX|nr:hypothetical protein Nham_1940 [Nitrobacter hamburgensis X14]
MFYLDRSLKNETTLMESDPEGAALSRSRKYAKTATNIAAILDPDRENYWDQPLRSRLMLRSTCVFVYQDRVQEITHTTSAP